MTAARRVCTLLVALAVAAVAGCTPVHGPDAQATSTPPVVDHAAPSITPNPSFPPIGGIVPTGITVGTSELLIWFGRFDSRADDVGLDHAWYDGRTGALADPPEFKPGADQVKDWISPCSPPAPMHLHELWLVDDREVDFGFVTVPVDRVTMTQGGHEYQASLRPWAEDPNVVAFWLVRPIAPTSWAPPVPEADLPRITATSHGSSVVDHLFRPCPPPAQPRV